LTFITVPKKASYSEAKRYYRINLLYFMQKTMQKLLARIISDDSLGIPNITIPICLQTREIHKKHNATIYYTYTGRNQRSYTWALIDIEGSFDTNSREKKCSQMACAWRNILMMTWLHAGWQKNYSHTHRRNRGGICGQVLSTEGHFISTVELWGVDCHRGSREWLLYTRLCAILISRKLPNIFSQLLQEALSMKHAQFTAVLIFLYSIVFYCMSTLKTTTKT